MHLSLVWVLNYSIFCTETSDKAVGSGIKWITNQYWKRKKYSCQFRAVFCTFHEHGYTSSENNPTTIYNIYKHTISVSWCSCNRPRPSDIVLSDNQRAPPNTWLWIYDRGSLYTTTLHSKHQLTLQAVAKPWSGLRVRSPTCLQAALEINAKATEKL